MVLISIHTTIKDYLESIRAALSDNTFRSYSNALHSFEAVLIEHKIDLNSSISGIPKEGMVWFSAYLEQYSHATGKLYITNGASFYEAFLPLGF
jgi:site-specific recombinase XerD